ncbi:MAG: 4Fe-4S cluster-binding domain-containing protein [[Clostridium] leptum]
MSKLRLAGVIKESIVDGPGIRFVVFGQGCPHRCPGCQNPQTHDFSGGYDTTTERLLAEIRKNPMLKGITLSGGDPFVQPEAMAELAEEAHKLGLNVVTYTGYTIEELLNGLEGHRLAAASRAVRHVSRRPLYSGTEINAAKIQGL